MLLQNDYFRNRDTDWFIHINDMPIHVASGGGALPYIIQEDFERNKKLLREINRRPNFFLKREIRLRKMLLFHLFQERRPSLKNTRG